jgi:hypothetical protein
MAESSSIMGLVAAFIGIAIMLAIGIQILGNVQLGTQCATLPGGPGLGPSGKWVATTSNSTGWALSCVNNNTSIQNAYTLLIVILIVIAAVAILFVVRLL